ncbi:MAG: hypothetical protein JW982_08110 [Spirochaetes bacterium]|nr:hypothetical protein [Spirochaetota bacterium]
MSKININVSSVPASVVKLHIAVLNGGSIVSQKSFLRNEINADGSIELTVTAGNNREIILVAENAAGQAGYFGNVFADLTPGQVVVNIDMKLPTAITFTETYPGGSIVVISWTNCGTSLTRYYFTDFGHNFYWSGYESSVSYNFFTTPSRSLIIKFEFCNVQTAVLN